MESSFFRFGVEKLSDECVLKGEGRIGFYEYFNREFSYRFVGIFFWDLKLEFERDRYFRI